MYAALGIAVLGGTFVAGVRVGQKVPREVMPFFDTQTAEPGVAVPIVAPDEGPVDDTPERMEEPEALVDEPAPGAARQVQREAAPAVEVVLERDAPRDEEPVVGQRVLAREGSGEAESRRTVYVSADSEGR